MNKGCDKQDERVREGTGETIYKGRRGEEGEQIYRRKGEDYGN
jgi:hypothetical protein